MTEYEIADLAVSTQAVFFQQLELAQGMADRVLGLVQQFGNLLFGYLIVAYFVGANLTRVQTAILNTLYLAWQARISAMLYGIYANAAVLLEEMAETSPDTTGALTVPSLTPTYVLLAGVTLASLYFMWSIRHPKKE